MAKLGRCPSKYPASQPSDCQVLHLIFWTSPLIVPPYMALITLLPPLPGPSHLQQGNSVFLDCMHQWFRKCSSPAERRSPSSSETISRFITAIKSHLTRYHGYQVTYQDVPANIKGRAYHIWQNVSISC